MSPESRLPKADPEDTVMVERGKKLVDYLNNLPTDSPPSPEEASEGLILKDIIKKSERPE